MKNIFKAIGENFIWLFSDYGFRIVDSTYHNSFGGQGSIKLVNDVMCLQFINDRHQVYIEFSPKQAWKNNKSASFDIIYEIINEKIYNNSILNDEQIDYLKNNFDKIISLFNNKDSDNLLSKVELLKRKRAKRLFG